MQDTYYLIGLLSTLGCMAETAHLKSACPQNHGSIIKCVFDSSQAIPDCILDLRQGVVGRPLYEDSTGSGVPHILYKGVFVFSKDMLVNLSGVPGSNVRAALTSAGFVSVLKACVATGVLAGEDNGRTELTV